MKIQQKAVKVLKKVDDTSPKRRTKKEAINKPIAKPKVKKQTKKTLKMLPGQRILSFTPNIIKTKSKTLEFLCVDQKTMGWPEEFTNKIISHDYDNDQDSTDYIVSKQVEKGIATLVEQITFKKILEMEDTMGF